MKRNMTREDRLKAGSRIRTISWVLAVLIVLIIAGVFLFYHWFGFRDERGLSLASSLQRQTDNLAAWSIDEKNGIPVLLPAGKEQMDQTGGWLQILDEQGNSILFYRAKKEDTQSGAESQISIRKEETPVIKKAYSTDDLLNIVRDPRSLNGSCFISTVSVSEKKWILLCHYPIPIASTIIYYNSGNLPRLSPLFWLIPGLMMPFLIGLILWQYFSINRMISRIKAVRDHRISRLPLHFPWRSVDLALENLERELESSDRLRQENENLRRDWIAGVSHDLKTPLSPVKGYAELLKTSRGLDVKDQHRYGQIILENAGRLEQRIENLQLAYQIDGGYFPFHSEKLDMEYLVRSVLIDILNDPAFAQSEVEYEKQDENDPETDQRKIPDSESQEAQTLDNSWMVYGDKALLYRAIENLTVNALRHNPAGTNIRIRLTKESGWISLSFCDNGPGISREDCTHIFEPYYQAKKLNPADKKISGSRKRGQGLGLSLALQIVQLHHGSLKVESEQGKGSEFILSLPAENENRN